MIPQIPLLVRVLLVFAAKKLVGSGSIGNQEKFPGHTRNRDRSTNNANLDVGCVFRPAMCACWEFGLIKIPYATRNTGIVLLQLIESFFVLVFHFISYFGKIPATAWTSLFLSQVSYFSPAAARSLSTRSIFSQGKPSRPKWP